MCSHQEWEGFTRRFEDTIGERQVREFVADAAARIEALVDELKRRACAPEDADWACGRGRRSRTQWILRDRGLRRQVMTCRRRALASFREPRSPGARRGHDAAGHEPRCSYGFARAGHFNDFDNAPSSRDFDPATGPGGNDLVGARTVVRSYNDFHAIALHRTSVLRLSRWAA
jgi:hypothetical protein